MIDVHEVIFFLIAVFFSVRTKLQTEVMAARLEARNLHLPHQACRSFSDYFYASVFSLNTTSCEATSLHNPSKVSTGKQNEHHAI